MLTKQPIKQKLKECSHCKRQVMLWKSNPPLCKNCNDRVNPRKPIVSRPKKKSVYEEKRELNIWFAEQINIMPRYCEETGNYLNPYMPWGARAYIAHICPKRHFKSVQCHPANRMFYDIDAHTNFDRATSKEIKQMKSYPLIVQRFNEFKNLIPQSEYEHLLDYLFELL